MSIVLLAPPSATLAQYEEMLDGLVLDARDHSPKIIADDFYGGALDWGSRETTFRGRGLGSIVELTYLSTSLPGGMVLRMNEYYTHSDHQAILLDIRNGRDDRRVSIKSGKTRIAGWSTGAFEAEAFLAV